MKRTIFVFNDGTGQALKSDAQSNVAKIFNALPGKVISHEEADSYKFDENQAYHAFYIRGIGTESLKPKDKTADTRSWFQKLGDSISGKAAIGVELATGHSISDRVERSLKCIESLWQEGDRVFFIGFSRGAASVRLGAAYLGSKIPKFEVEYLLVFDTVYSVLTEVQIREEPKRTNFEETNIGTFVKRCDHIIAGDEMRDMFPVTPVTVRPGVRQILFAGSHSDVGGGNPSASLSDISLDFVMGELKGLGILFDSANVAALQIRPDPTAKITFDKFNGTGQTHFPRDLRSLSFLIHESVFKRANAKQSVSIALAQLATFDTTSKEALVEVASVNTRFGHS
ncbi:hypothetical protein DOM22_06595 [Bdellovibrio sp. ZAP7]|uniref:phospholipase effector Tle1 domain-containing protein n=1 Tax=Bdellovibrio sp. ZAP7 TaxID=2231053 RepID=UPI00115BD7FF|nr:DUF2235 domain-containing protein [Bdellovibrio sp. ZAP7]QDK44852.1 hypothetical protein DOM22_06595 [Bdellovibrio sp. ZAP7]